jgi:hypothetical protein
MSWGPPFDFPCLARLAPQPRKVERVVEVRVEVPVFSTFTAEEKTWAIKLIEAGYKALARKHHPDRGGATGAMQLLNAVVDKLRAATELER